MNNVIDIRSKQPHLTGNVKCLHCKHRWTGVSEIGIIDGLECPECKLFKGVFEALCFPENVKYLECECGNGHFCILENQDIYCAYCAIRHGKMF